MSEKTSGIALLDDYVTGMLDDDAANAVEERLFDAPAVGDALAADLAFFDRSHRLLGWLAAHVALDRSATAADVAALRSRGLKVHQQDVLSNAPTDVEPWADDVDVVVFVVRTDVRGWDEVEVEVTNADGTPVKTFRGVLGEPGTGNLYAVCAPPLAKLGFGVKTRVARVTGMRNGQRELISTFETHPRVR